MAGYQAVKTALHNNVINVTATNRLEAADKTSRMVNGNLINPNRAKRNQAFSFLTAEEAVLASTVQDVQSYPINQLAIGCNSAVTITNIPKKGGVKKNHHLSEINVAQPDGSRYVYGIPTYNLKQRDVSFSVDKATFQATSSPISNGLIRYVSDKIKKDSSSLIASSDVSIDNSIENRRAKDNYFDATELPAYAHSFLLTSVLSSDYVDVKNDGVTEDDLGNAVKINYSSITTKLDQYNNLVSTPYKWRTPYHVNRARYQEGNKSDTKDDKASYVYGEKEIWYMHSIETRTMVAQFYLSDREDAYGVLGEDGGRDATQKLKQLDMIKLFSKSELISKGANAIPIKTVHLKYDYSLCPGIPNNSGVIVTDPLTQANLNAKKGKLTLKSVYFSYADNDRGKYNRYNFSYKNNTAITYDLEKTDRWGMYRDIAQLGANTPSSNEFPYTLQDENYYNNPTTGVAGLWSLNQIELPSGGKINVTYEIDDYADLQDKRAAQMFLINGFASSTTATISNQLYTVDLFKPFQVNSNKYLVVDIPPDLLTSNNNALEEAKVRFFENQDQYLYFQSLVELTSGNSDYVSGYLEYNKDNTQIFNNKLYIGIKGISTDREANALHPITKAGLQQLRLGRPDLAYPDFTTKGKTPKQIVASMGGIANEVVNLILGFDYASIGKGWCKTVNLSKSWIRLTNPNFKKLGGGIRVKKVTISDEWNVTNGGGKSEYGQEYSYTKEAENLFGRKITKSSGVASYEPAIGGEENALHLPMPYGQKVILAPDNRYYTERPVGESLYPGPVVGYSEVTVKNLQYTNVTKNATGWMKHQFYTAKDFPVISEMTSLQRERLNSQKLNSVLKFFVFDHHNASQGFYVETNDMHGKPKSEAMYNQVGAIINSTEYIYKKDSKTGRLTNKISAAGTDGKISEEEIGVDMDLWQEMNQDESSNINGGLDVSVDVGFWGFFPIIIPMVIPQLQYSSQRLRTAATTKFVKRFGILDKVIKMENGSTISTENVLYDKETGQVLVTKTQNEFNDPIYNFSYPAHWAYDGMGQAYKNLGAIFTGVSISANGELALLAGTTNANTFLTSGDEILLTNPNGTAIGKGKFYVVNVDKAKNPAVTTTKFIIMDENGKTVNESILPTGVTNTSPISNVVLKVIRSGRRNMASASIGAIVSVKAPFNAQNISIPTNTPFALSAGITEFKDIWAASCKKLSTGFYEVKNLNPYTSGNWGNWRPNKSLIYHKLVENQGFSLPTNIQKNGTIDGFVAGWSYTNVWKRSSSSDWITKNTINRYDERGNEIDNIDALKVNSSAYYGYNNNLVTAVAANAASTEISFESFEDYNFSNLCNQTAKGKNIKLFKTGQTGISLSNKAAHTGKYAMEIVANSSINSDSLLASCSPTDVPGNFLTITSDNSHLQNTCTSCQGSFGTSYYGKDMIVSIWVATTNSLASNQINTADFEFQIKNLNSTIPAVTLQPNGPVIDGWQKLEVKINVPKPATGQSGGIYFVLKNKNIEAKVYYDDFRILPYAGKMKAYVYDPFSLRLMAELDENHYATFYEYDDEGMLVRVKRETEKGIVTIKEVRTVVKPTIDLSINVN